MQARDETTKITQNHYLFSKKYILMRQESYVWVRSGSRDKNYAANSQNLNYKPWENYYY